MPIQADIAGAEKQTQLSEIHRQVSRALNSAQCIRAELYDLAGRLGLLMPPSDQASLPARPARGDAVPHRIMDAGDGLQEVLLEIERLTMLLRDHG